MSIVKTFSDVKLQMFDRIIPVVFKNVFAQKGFRS